MNGTSKSCGCARRATPEHVQARFWGKVHRGATPQDCWIWRGSFHDESGVPVFAVGEAQVTALRYMYSLQGRGVLDNKNVRHVCGNKACVNPRHLTAIGTDSAEAIERMQAAWQRAQAAKAQEQPLAIIREALPSAEVAPVPLLPGFLDAHRAFWSNVTVSDPAACWPWTGYIDPDGYGRFYLVERGTGCIAPRLAYEFATGQSLGELQACHRCDNRACCNPLHIFGASLQDNMADKRLKGRAASGMNHGAVIHPETRPRGLNHPRAALTAGQVREIRRLRAEGLAERVIAERIGCSRCAVRGVVKGKTYLDVPRG